MDPVEVESDPKKRGVGKTVLVVDDYALIRKKLPAAFLSDGFKTCGEAENGKEAIELAERIRPDVIILDFMMPMMNGLEAAPKLRKIFPNTPIILFTLYEDNLSKKEVSDAGISLVLSKAAQNTGHFKLVRSERASMRRNQYSFF
jgi:DNA-binding NarL/FixJ family response regulator